MNEMVHTFDLGGGFERLLVLGFGTSGSTSSEEVRLPNKEEIASFNTFALSPLRVEGDPTDSDGIFSGEGVTDEGTLAIRAALIDGDVIG